MLLTMAAQPNKQKHNIQDIKTSVAVQDQGMPLDVEQEVLDKNKLMYAHPWYKWCENC